MRFLNYIDRKFDYESQKRFTVTMPIGASFGYLLSEGIKMAIDWQKYKFDVSGFIFIIIFWLLILSPFIINRIKYEAKYKKILEKVISNSNKLNLNVKAKFDYDKFKKGELYKIDVHDTYLYILECNDIHYFKNIINKFEFDDIKEERLKKLKRLKRL